MTTFLRHRHHGDRHKKIEWRHRSKTDQIFKQKRALCVGNEKEVVGHCQMRDVMVHGFRCKVLAVDAVNVQVLEEENTKQGSINKLLKIENTKTNRQKHNRHLKAVINYS